jgi:hypothetical protein
LSQAFLQRDASDFGIHLSDALRISGNPRNFETEPYYIFESQAFLQRDASDFGIQLSAALRKSGIPRIF